jgi:hypothetical protein
LFPAVLALTLAIAATSAGATDVATAKPALQLRPKAAIIAATPNHHFAPFVEPLSEPELDLIPRRDQRLEQSRSSCNGERALCYDPGSGRIVYKPARALMPDIPGMQPENISVKRDRIVLRYSF